VLYYPPADGMETFLIISGIAWLISMALELHPGGSQATPALRNAGTLCHMIFWCDYVGYKVADDRDDDAELASFIMRGFAIMALGSMSVINSYTTLPMPVKKNYAMYAIMIHWLLQGVCLLLTGAHFFTCCRSVNTEYVIAGILWTFSGVEFILCLFLFYLYKRQVYPNPAYITYHMFGCAVGVILYFIAMTYSYTIIEDYDNEVGMYGYGYNEDVKSKEVAWQVFYGFVLIAAIGFEFYLVLEEESEEMGGDPVSVAINQSAVAPKPAEQFTGGAVIRNDPSPNAPPAYKTAPPAYQNATGSGAPEPSTGPSADNIAGQIQALNNMRNQGVLSEEEFTKAKAKLLG